MIYFQILILPLLFTSVFTDSICGDWEPYKDEKCFKIIDEMNTYEDAVKLCHSKEADSSLLEIGSAEEQEFVTKFLFKTRQLVDPVWLGVRRVSGKFKATDGTEVKYTNWAPGSPSNLSDTCVQMIPEPASQGKWIDEPCKKKNLVVCQKPQTWSIAKLQQTLLDARKEYKELNEAARKECKESIENIHKNPVPLGFIYVQLPKEPEPKSLWPTVEWKDVSSEYAGLFFRADGGGAEAFGKVQTENAPRVTQITLTRFEKIPAEYGPTNAVVGSWSTGNGVFSGSYVDGSNAHTHKFFTSGGEVRPKNMAMRIWKRVK